MSSETSRQFIERYAKVMNGGSKSPDLVEEYVSDEALKAHIAAFEVAFPGYEVDVHDILADGNKVALRGTFRGVHRGEFQGIAPTGRAVSVPLMLMYRIADGRISEHWMNADVLSLLQQLGTAPVPA